MSRIFIASRYQQYRQFGRVPNSRNFLMTILISAGIFALGFALSIVVNATLYSSYYTQ